ncbi:MAG: hypothetical protein ABIB97_03685 [Patescibacteria group bacterium]
MPKTPSYTPPTQVSGYRIGKMMTGMFGFKGSARQLKSHSAYGAVLKKAGPRATRMINKAMMEKGAASSTEVKRAIRNVQGAIKDAAKDPEFRRQHGRLKYNYGHVHRRSSSEVFKKESETIHNMMTAGRRTDRARAAEKEIEEAKAQRYAGVAKHRRPDKTDTRDSREPLAPTRTIKARGEEGRQQAMKKIDELKAQRKGEEGREKGLRASALDKSKISALEDQEVRISSQKRETQTSISREVERGSNVPMEQEEQTRKIEDTPEQPQDMAID